MRGGQEDESKAMGPMFPRLHVNDTNKGGPRAPPRNKMALYEQFSVPSQRFNSNSLASTRPQQKGGSVVPSDSSSQVCVMEKLIFLF
jgi:protein EARLY FLOWERING 3